MLDITGIKGGLESLEKNEYGMKLLILELGIGWIREGLVSTEWKNKKREMY